MDTPFVYNEYVTEKNFIGRSTERKILANLIKAGEHVSIYEPPKTGKMSLLMQVFSDLRNERTQFLVAMVDMLIVRTLEQFHFCVQWQRLRWYLVIRWLLMVILWTR